MLLLATFLGVVPVIGADAEFPHDDRIRIAEARRIMAEVADDIWPGWSKTAFPIILITRDEEYIISDNLPVPYSASAHDSLLGSDVFLRHRVYSRSLLATFPALGGVPTVVIGQPKYTEASHTTRWVMTLLHEHFHQWQQSQPDYFSSTTALGLARGDSTGMWMLTYPFPYDDRRVNEVFAELCRRLHDAVKAVRRGGFTRKLDSYLEAREAFRRLLTKEDYTYFSFQVWQEGIARYTEYRLAKRLAMMYRPSEAFKSLPDYSSFDQDAQRTRDHILTELHNMSLKKAGRTAFYQVGAAEGMLLDHAQPEWRSRYLREKFYVDRYFGREVPSVDTGEAARPWTMRRYGSLREIFHGGATGPVIGLNDLPMNEQVYAVGALSELRGEITIVAGRSFVSYPTGLDRTRTESPPDEYESACLLVAAEVPAWVDVTLEGDVPFSELDKVMGDLAAAVGLERDAAFPFVVESQVRDLQWHVIDGSRLPADGGSHADHLSAAVKHRVDRRDVTLVGFYSNHDHGVFTHRGSNTHVHCVVAEPLSTGHVDHVVLPAGTVVRLPAP